MTDERPDFDLVVYPGVMIRPYSVKRSFVGVTHFVFQFSVDWKVSRIVISPRRALPPAGECIITDVPTARPAYLKAGTRNAPDMLPRHAGHEGPPGNTSGKAEVV